MKPEQKSLRIGTAVLLFALFLRVLSGLDVSALRSDGELAALLLRGGTGRIFTVDSDDPVPTAPQPQELTEPTTPVVEETEPPQPQVFSSEDAVLVSVTNHPGYDIDVESLLQTPLQWDLTIDQPTVLIIHSHASESYENTEGYTPSDLYRTMDNRYNMISIGEYLTQCLRQRGISVLHDTTIHDYPSYDDAYTQSRKTVQAYLEAYPTIALVLDIHRDAYADKNGDQIRNVITVDGKSASRLMLVAGTNAYGQGHTQWMDNMAVAVKLQAVLQQQHPGLCRNLTVRSSAFNQDLSPGSLLIEVGTAGDTRQDALYAAQLLADGIAALAYGSQ